MPAAITVWMLVAILSFVVQFPGTAHSKVYGPCPVGEVRPVETDLKILTPPFVMGCADLRHHGQMELIAYREGRSLGRSDLCVEMQAATVTVASCRRPSDAIHGLEHGYFTALNRRWVLVEGFASLPVARVRLRYRSLDEVRRPQGIITRITDAALLGRLSLTKPFAHFVVEASRHARSVSLLARNAGNKLVFWRSLPDVQDFLKSNRGEVLGEIPLPRGRAAQRAPAASAIAR